LGCSGGDFSPPVFNLLQKNDFGLADIQKQQAGKQILNRAEGTFLLRNIAYLAVLTYAWKR